MIEDDGTGAAETPRPSRRPHVPAWRWAQWGTAWALALVVFYVLLTPVWFSLRALAWAAEFRARRRRPAAR